MGDDLSMGIKELLREKREDILHLAIRHGARNVRLFGSVARGDAGPQSDVDFLVRLDPGTTLLDHAALVRELKLLLGIDVQVVSEKALRERIKDRVMQEAVPL
jgi:predicted nucleotidyltransferase